MRQVKQKEFLSACSVLIGRMKSIDNPPTLDVMMLIITELRVMQMQPLHHTLSYATAIKSDCNVLMMRFVLPRTLHL